MKRIIITINLIITIVMANPVLVHAGEISDRLNQYPEWSFPSNVKQTSQDLLYPNWMSGTWDVTSILVDQVAPFAPEIVTPGFESNKSYLHQPINFKVRFQQRSPFLSSLLSLPSLIASRQPIVADREFNGLNIGQAYLGKDGILSVKTSPKNPNDQITFLPENNKLISRITGRIQETSNVDEFFTTEITQQIFQGSSLMYLNQVETTTAYHLLTKDTIEAEQVTAIYLSPKDPNYFKTINHPVSLYRYQLKLRLLT
ncbi:MAG TPA: hypothetical protein DCF68_00780 [Cyanothece sp. UBA12306]|nr:hypothetical protein [Cyanothece sp. UBA12306]